MAVHALRLLIRRYRLAATLLFVAALTLRILIPGGFMPTVDHGHIVVKICNGVPGASMVMAIPGLDRKSDPAGPAGGKCAFADLTLALTGGTDPVLLAAALVFALTLIAGLSLALPLRTPARLRPPLRGPPLPA